MQRHNTALQPTTAQNKLGNATKTATFWSGSSRLFEIDSAEFEHRTTRFETRDLINMVLKPYYSGFNIFTLILCHIT